MWPQFPLLGLSLGSLLLRLNLIPFLPSQGDSLSCCVARCSARVRSVSQKGPLSGNPGLAGGGGGGGGSRVPVGSGQQCVTVGALLLAHLPFTAPNRFSELSIPSAKVMLRHPQVPNPTPHLVPAACKSRPGRVGVPGSAVMEAGERWTTSLRSDCGHTQGPSQG